MKPDEAVLVHLALAASSAEMHAIELCLGTAGLVARWIEHEQALSAELGAVRFLLVGRPPRLDWSNAGQLALLQVAGAGVDPLFPAAGLSAQTHIASSRGVSTEAVRDHVLGLLLSLARALPRYVVQQRERAWLRHSHSSVAGKRLTLVGFGQVGQAVAQAARVLGMRVRAVSRGAGAVVDGEPVFPSERLHEALRDADFVVVCVPLTQETRGLIDARALSMLSSEACLIDVSRGGVVDEGALEAALRSRKLAAAARDVFELEPLPADHSLWSCPNLSITPHVGGLIPDYLLRVVELFVDNVQLVRSGAPPRTLVSRELEY